MIMARLKHTTIAFVCLFCIQWCYGQDTNGLIINNRVFVVMDGGAFIVLDSPKPEAITLTGNQRGGIISEDEDNKVRWEIRDTTGTYRLPWYTAAPGLDSIPFICDVTSAGTGVGRIDHSTYTTVLSANNSPWPSMVTCMDFQDCWFQGFNHTLYAVDRFWIADARNYTVRPSSTLSFTFPNSEMAAPNTIVGSSLKAMRFDDGNGNWVGFSGGDATTGPTLGRVDNVVVPAAHFFSAWTLVDRVIMLPVELVNFKVQCDGNDRLFYWETVSETNNSFFVLEKSWDGKSFFAIDQVPGAGTSLQPSYYSALDTDADREAFYRLMQVDFDGAKTYSDVITGKTCNQDVSGVQVYPNPSNGLFHIETGSKSSSICRVSNMIGKTVHHSVNNSGSIKLDLSNEPAGVYLLEVEFAAKQEVIRLIKH